MGREELVEPARSVARVVRVDRRAAGVGVAGVGARILLHVREAVEVEVAAAQRAEAVFAGVRTRARVAVHVEFPAVRHAVAIRIGAVAEHGGLVAASRVEGVRHRVGDVDRRRVRLVLGILGVRILGARIGGVIAIVVVVSRRSDHDRRIRRLRAHEVPGRLPVRLVLRVDDAVVQAVLHDEVFVIVVVGARVDRDARRVEERERLVHARVPAGRDVAGSVLVPARARIEAERVTHLVVDEHVAGFRIDGRSRRHLDVARRNRIGVDHREAVAFRLAALGVDVSRQAVGQVDRIALAVNRLLRLEGEALDHDVADHLLRFGVPVAARDEAQEHLHRRAVLFHDARGAVGREVGHVVAVRVAGLRAVQRIEAHHDFPAVAHVVAVRIPVGRVRAEDELLEIGQAVVIEVGVVREPVLGKRLARIEARLDVGGGNLVALEDVVHVEALVDVLLARTRIRRRGARRVPDVGGVPEEVLPAVRQAVTVRVGHRRVHAAGLAGRLRGPLLEVRGARVEDVRPRVGFPRRLLVLVEVDVGRREVGRVEAGREATELETRREGQADRRIAAARRDAEGHAVSIARQAAGEEVLVGVAAREVAQVVRHDHVLARVVAHRQRNQVAAVPVRHRERIRHAVLVDVAEVVGRHPFLREDRLDLRVDVAAVLRLLGRELHDAGTDLARTLRQDRVAENRLGLVTLARGAVEDPAVEEGVLVARIVRVEVGHRVAVELRRGHARLRAARRVEGDVHAVQRAVVVRTRDLVTEGVDLFADVLRAVPAEVEVLRARESRAVDPGVALAELVAAEERVLLGERRGGHAAERTRRDRREELRRGHLELPRPALIAAVLVLDDEGDILVALRVAEVRIEDAARGLGHVLLGRVLAAEEGDLDAGERRDAGEVALHVALDLPANRMRHRDAARHFPAVRVLLRVDDADRLHVVHEHTGLIAHVVLARRRVARRQLRVADDFRLDGEAVERGDFRTVHILDEEVDRQRVADLDIVHARLGVRILVVKLEEARVRLARAVLAHGHLDLQLVGEERIPVAELDLDLARAVVLVERLRRDDHDLRIVEHRHADRIGRLGPVLHVLVLDLELQRPLARTREVVHERMRRRIALDRLGLDRADACERRRPLALERLLRVLDVVLALVGHDRHELLRHALRHLVREHVAVALGLEAVHLDARDRRVEVEDREVEVVRVIARDLLRRIPRLARAEHDLERHAETARVLAVAVEELDLARRSRVLVVVDRKALRLGEIRVVADDEHLRAADHAGLHVVARLEEGVDRAARVVLLGNGNLERRLVTLMEDVGAADRHDVRGAGLLDVGRKVADLALLAAHRGDDVDLAGETLARRRVVDDRKIRRLVVATRAVVRELHEHVALAHVVDAVKLLERVRGTILDEDLVARLVVADVGVGVAHRKRELDVVAADAVDDRALGRGRDHRGVRTDLQARRREVVDLAQGRLVRDGRGEDHARAAARVRVAAEEEGVDLLLGRRAGRDRHLRKHGLGKRRHLVLRRGEAHVVAPRRRRAVREGRRHRDLEVARVIALREVDRQERAVVHVVAVRVRDLAVALDDHRRRHRLDALHRHFDVVLDARAGAVRVVVADPRAEDEVARLALRDALNLEIGRHLAARERDVADDRLLLDRRDAVVADNDLLDVAALDAHGRVVGRPDVKRHRVLRRRDGLQLRGRTDRDGRVLVHRAPQLTGLALRDLPLAVEIDRLHVDAALRERVVLAAGAVRRGNRELRRPEPEVAVLTRIIAETPLVRTVQQIGQGLVRVGRRHRITRRRHRREHDRQREVARTRLVLEHEVGEARGRIRRRVDERRVAQLTGHVDADLQRIQRVVDELRTGAHVFHLPDRGGITLRALDQAHLEVHRFARGQRVGDRRVRRARRTLLGAGTDFVDVTARAERGGAGRQSGRQGECLEEFVGHHMVRFPFC